MRPNHQHVGLAFRVGIDQLGRLETDLRPEVDPTLIRYVRIDGDPLPSQLRAQVQDQGGDDFRTKPTSSNRRNERHVESTSGVVVICSVVLHEADWLPGFLDDEAFDLWASRSRVLRRDLLIGEGSTAPAFVEPRVCEEAAQDREVGVVRGA